ncbi:MAG: polysaccharide biosynthesis/export family protein [Candidatus Aminicenantes bacterium]|nr:MAG: polysaccharide biosynthesis/export family protein [Candidatus Aminicenantes bacterium]
MKKSAINIFILLFILQLVSCLSNRSIHLINLTSKKTSAVTELILTTSSPVQYSDTKLENPPAIIISFPENKIFAIEEDIVINKGAIKKVKYEYIHRGNQGQRQLNLVIVELTQDLPYKITNSGSSIIISVENPRPSLVAANNEKAKNETRSPNQDKSLSLQPGYLIGPGDVLSIEVWGQPDVSREATVNYLGEIRLPPIKKISVIGLSIPQLEERLSEALSKYLIDPIVFVSIKEYNSQRVIALGEIKTGMYTLKRKTTLVEFFGQIGATTDITDIFSENADIFHIKLIKKDGKILTYDLNELINDPQRNEQVLVSGGDTVYVPPLEINKIFVLGEVKNPKAITIKGKLSIVEAITEAGGYTRDAVTKSIMIIRGDIGSQRGIRVNLSRILKKGDVGQNIELKAGDIVYVPKTFVVDIERFIRVIGSPLYWIFWYTR